MQILLCFPLSLQDAATTTEDEEGEKKEIRDPDTRKKILSEDDGRFPGETRTDFVQRPAADMKY